MPHIVDYVMPVYLRANAEARHYHLAKELHKNTQFCLLVILINHESPGSRLKDAVISVTSFNKE